MKCLLFLPLVLVQASIVPNNVRDNQSLTKCLDETRVPYVDSHSANWTDAIEPQNLRVHFTPKALVYATTTSHIQNAVRCANKHHVKVTAKSGGHSYASYGLGGEDGHLVIQLDHMYGVRVRDDGTAVINAGTRLGHATLELFNQAKRGVSWGSCPSVGLGGHAVHGGFGLNSHTHGLALDAMIGANVVLANGTLVHTSKTEHPDLFWALQGAGSSFGIVVDFELETFAVPEKLTWIDVKIGILNGTKEEAVSGFLEWQDLLATKGIDRKLNMQINVVNQILVVVYHGPKEDALKALEPLEGPLSFDWTDDDSFVKEGDWLDSVRAKAGSDPLDIKDEYKGHSNAYKSSLMTKPLSRSSVEAFFGYLFDTARAPAAVPWWLLIDVHGDANSVIAKVPIDATSYVHRDKLWIFQFAGTLNPGDNVEESIRFVKGFMNSIQENIPASDWGRYANYIDSELTKDQAQHQYWGSHLQRLQAIKFQVDGDDVFSSPQSVEPKAESWNLV